MRPTRFWRPGRCSAPAHPWPNRRRLGKIRLDSVCCVSCVTMCQQPSMRKLGPSERREGERSPRIGRFLCISFIVRGRNGDGQIRSNPSDWRYGHIGNGHPHFNLLARNGGELDEARGCRADGANGSATWRNTLRQSMASKVKEFPQLDPSLRSLL